MAFNFNGLQKAIGQTNIFDPQSPETQSGQTQQNVFRTSSPGLPGPAPGPSGGVQSVNPSAKQGGSNFTPGQAMAAYSGVKGTDTTKAVGGIQGNIQAAQEKLQAKANEYGAKVETAKAGNALGSDVIQGAINGDDKALQQTQGRLTQTMAKPIEGFEGLKDEELPTLADPLKYQNQWGEIFRPQAGANYTAGQSNYEDLLLGRNNQFSNLAASLSGQQQGVIDQSDKMRGDETKKAQDILNADYAAQTDAIRGQLTGAQKDLKTNAITKERMTEAERKGLSKQQILNDQLEKMRPDVAQFLKDSGEPGWENQLWQAAQDPRLQDTVNINGDVNWQDMMGEEDVGRFNRISSLLGNGDMLQYNKTPGAAYDFDQGSAEKLINQIILGKAQESRRVDETRNASLAAEKQRAEAEAQAAHARELELQRQKQLAAIAAVEAKARFRSDRGTTPDQRQTYDPNYGRMI